MAVASTLSIDGNGHIPGSIVRNRWTKDVVFTPANAAYWLSLRWDRQRPISAVGVERYVAAIERGEMTTIQVTVALLPDGKRLLVDGQHRISALASLGKHRPDLALEGEIIWQRVKDEQDAGRLFSTIDVGVPRKAHHIFRALQIGEGLPLTPQTRDTLARGVPLVSSRFSRDPRRDSHLSVAQESQKWLDEIVAYAQFTEGATAEVGRKLKRVSVVAVALATIRYQPALAREFWRGCALEDGLKKGDPRATLLAWLREYRPGGIPGSSSPITYCQYVATAWNAFFDHRSITFIRVTDKSGPVVIAGTIYGKAR